MDETARYATRVVLGEDGLPDSICACPYALNCKHGVAVVIEYLKRVENNRSVPKAKQDDDRLQLLADENRDDEPNDAKNGMYEDMRQDIDGFLKGKTKAQLINLIHELAGQHPEIAAGS